MKKTVSALLALLLCFLLAAPAFAADVVASGECGENLTWTLDSEGTLTISGMGEMEDYLWFSDVPWYSRREDIRRVEIKSGVTSIGNAAFEHCSSLTSVSISEGVTSIGSDAFLECDSLISVSIPESVTSIAGLAFQNCSSLTSVSIPESVTTIGFGAFRGCSSLMGISVASGNSNYKDIDGVLFSKDTTTLHTFPAGWEVESYIIPEGVTSIGSNAFDDCSSLTSVSIPESVTSIGDTAFLGCSSLTSVSISESVASIGYGAFAGCSKLADISVASGNSNYKDIDGVLFSKDTTTLHSFPAGRKVEAYIIPESVTSIGKYAFWGCWSLTSVSLSESVTSIDNSAFYGCSSLTDVYYAGTEAQWGDIEIDNIGNYPLTSATIHYNSSEIPSPTPTPTPTPVPEDVVASGECGKDGDNVTWTLDSEGTLTISGAGEMEDYWNGAPWHSKRENILCVEIQSGVTSIGKDAFYECSNLTNVSIPEGVTSIGENAFGECSSLTSVRIPESVAFLDFAAFQNCMSLTSVSIPEGVTSIGFNAFMGCSSLTDITVASGNSNWKDIDGILFSKDTTTLYIFPGGRSGSYIIPESVTSIGDGAFERCSLTSVSISEGVSSVGEWTFEGCSSLTSVSIPKGVTSIAPGAFNRCSSLTDISVASGNSNYKDIDGVLFSIDTTTLHTFPGGRSGSYIIPKGVTSIGDLAFSLCNSLTSVSIPEGVTYIGDSTFGECSSLTSVSIPASVTSIGDSAFQGCISLTDVYYGGTEAQWGDIVIDSSNTPLTSATIHYNGAPEPTPTPTPTPEPETKSLDSAAVTVPKASYPYSGKAIKPNVTVKLDGEKLKKNADYTVKYTNNTKVGTATVTVTGKGEYTGTATTTFEIVSTTKPLDSATVTVPKASYDYTGKAIKPVVTVTLNGEKLRKNTDYTVTYKNNTKVGTATVTVTGKGNYTGTASTTFEIVSKTKPINSATVTVPKASYDYSGKAIKPVVTVKLDGKRLRKNTDYTVTYKNNTKVGTATITVTGKGDYTGTASVTFEIVSKTKPLDGATVTILRKSYTYTGKAIKPTVTVKLDGTRLRKNTDYTVTYKNNTKAGTATITITGKGDYTGTVTTTFLIVEK